MKIAIIIPCFNEEDCVAKVFNEISNIKIQGSYIEPIFINDCSKDNTLALLKSFHAKVLDLPVNLGIGGAVQTGFKYALLNNFDIAIQLDGDGQHPSDQIVNLIQPILTNEADVVIGSRFLLKEGFQSTFARRLGINYFKLLNKFLINKTMTDNTSGFRAINNKALKVVCNYYPDEYPEPEAIILFSLNNLRIKEIPVTMRERMGGQSSINSYRSIYYMIKVSLAIIFIYLRLKFNGKRSSI
jgi:glycosyltransferase involved in cell wall biosynthesis